jgi:hypothetical protein
MDERGNRLLSQVGECGLFIIFLQILVLLSEKKDVPREAFSSTLDGLVSGRSCRPRAEAFCFFCSFFQGAGRSMLHGRLREAISQTNSIGKMW